jgi:hypothetical protein
VDGFIRAWDLLLGVTAFSDPRSADNLCCISAVTSGCGCNDCPEDACHSSDSNEPNDGPPPMQVAFDLAAELGSEVILLNPFPGDPLDGEEA